jgi:hypothetical protein
MSSFEWLTSYSMHELTASVICESKEMTSRQPVSLEKSVLTAVHLSRMLQGSDGHGTSLVDGCKLSRWLDSNNSPRHSAWKETPFILFTLNNIPSTCQRMSEGLPSRDLA